MMEHGHFLDLQAPRLVLLALQVAHSLPKMTTRCSQLLVHCVAQEEVSIVEFHLASYGGMPVPLNSIFVGMKVAAAAKAATTRYFVSETARPGTKQHQIVNRDKRRIDSTI